ncbi:MAG: UDP-N-acetylmuramoyl-L-alanyl-D-glutamate--2,6-diaminopimelate ligase [Candidatus Staskawiczbacteria bacterium]|nr:UDP-N-acetylmuramoyl-L-alanyl-D-glutamate--2,6-diaminopimelate ligase [Candidatus Staskawiczbacteria bacterium]
MAIKETIKKITPKFFLSAYHYKLALLGAFLHGFAGKDKNMKIIGVTGTSGKSTTVDFITRILEEAGNKTASISSIRFKIGEKEWKNNYKMTMPGRLAIQKFLSQAKNAGCKFVVLEVTSEGIKQFRHKFINFDAAVFTNLGKEHLESHGGFENYRNEKLKLFKAAKNIHIINEDDENAGHFLKIRARKKIRFSIKNAKNIKSENGISFEAGGQKFNLNLLGEFNICNALAALCVAKAYGVDLKTCAKALEKARAIPGRMEIVAKQPFMTVVDYAHTPEQLEGVYKTLKNFKFQILNFKLICVLGSCGGGRDKWKRPELGKIAAKYCDKIIITNEDPYDEDPMEIISQVAMGAGGKAEKIPDRKEAINHALSFAKPGDIVIITGKGSEPWMCLKNGKKIPWDDRQTVRDFLNLKNL